MRHQTDRFTPETRTSSYTPPAPLDWQKAHDELSRLANTRARLDWEEGCSLLRANRTGAHLHLGFASFVEYVERLLGYKPRWTEERLRVAQALENLPELAQSLRDGTISWSAVRELTRVATPENEAAWLDLARKHTIRQVEELVAGHHPGDRPDDAYDPSRRKQVLRFEISTDTLATFRDAMAQLRREAGSPIDDDAALLLLARQVLGGPREVGRANYQVALTICEQCGRGWQQASGEHIELGSDVIEMAGCDAQRLVRPSEHQAANTTQTHVGAGAPTEIRRARQDVPPAIRREVMRRDGGRCVVPGCRHAIFVDIHHLILRSEGGDHDPDRLVVLCSAHHRALHRGQLMIAGCVSIGLAFRHSDGSSYGGSVSPHLLARHADAFRALRALGFREGEVRGALERIRKKNAGDTSIEQVLREALAVLADARRVRGPVASAAPPS